LIHRPEFADKCDWDRLEGPVWVELLIRRPMFADKCDWSKLGLNDFEVLFGERPELRETARRAGLR
jgi:hypothetical protein